MGDAELSGDGTGAATQNQRGAATWSPTHFKFFPGNAMLDAGSEGFGSSFFGGEAGGKTLSKAGSGAAIGDFSSREYTLQETVAIALNGARDARYFDEIDAGADQHEAKVAQE